MIGDVRQWLADGWRVVLVTEGHGPAQRLAEVLRGEGFGARLGDLEAEPEGGVPYVSTGELRQGFSWPAVKLALLTEARLRRPRRLAGRARGTSGGCRPRGGAAGSTRCSSGRATTWCTSSTASAGSSR